ncbi:MAG: Ig-like domain-containing protein [Clostridiales bacterium]|nr:Ig-like domain-containing protein [Clostridiales bacterium]
MIKTKNKKLYIAIVFVALALLLGGVFIFLNACKKDEESEDSKTATKPDYVALNMKQYSMIIGDELILSMDYDLNSDLQFTYSSSNDSVATVDELGKVVAIGDGTATITVTYGDASDSCEITVGRGNALAYLDFEQISTDSLCVALSEELAFHPIVHFNGKTFDDVQAEYTLSNDRVGVIENGVFTGSQLGKTDVYVSATWRGVGGETLTKMLTVEVVNDVQIFINDGKESEMVLYTLDRQAIPVTAAATENGAAITNLECDLVDGGDKYVDFDGDSIKTKGLAGETALAVRCVDSFGTTWEKRFRITIKQTVLDYAETLTGFSAIDGDFIGKTSFLKVLGGRLVKAEDANGNPLTVDGNKVFGVETNKKGLTQTQIIVYSARLGYRVNLEGYTGIIDEAEDLKWFGVKNDGFAKHPEYNEEVDKYDRGYTFLAQRQDGYYILANDIDASNYVQPNAGESLTNSISEISKYTESLGGIGLTGTFDGQGHTIRGLSVGRYGLFGIVFGGTLKNVAFTEVKSKADKYGSVIAQWLINATLDNVYLNVSSISGISAGALTGAMSGTSLRGCIIEYAATTSNSASYGSLTYMAYKEKGSSGYTANVGNGVYVISPLVCTNYELSDNSKHYVVDASNIKDTRFTYAGVKRYATQSDFENAAENFVAFENSCWDKSGATPVWKTKDFVLEEEDETDVETDASVGKFNPEWLL